MIKMIPAYYEPIEDTILKYLTDVYYKPIFELLKDPLYNSKNALINALRKGTIVFRGGVFYGKFNVSISRALSKFATFDKKLKVWKGNPPPDIKAAATIANDKARKLNEQINSKLSGMYEEMLSAVESFTYPIDSTAKAIDKNLDADIVKLGITPEMSQEASQKMLEEYTTNQNLNIKGWNTEQIERLRRMIEKNAMEGYSRQQLEQLIRSEYNTTASKAKFLARQETSLFMSKLRETRYSESNIQIYQWVAVDDNRTVGKAGGLYPSPTKGHGNHSAMNGKYGKMDDPTVYAETLMDAREGKWKSKATIEAWGNHPGEAFNCRCFMRPII